MANIIADDTSNDAGDTRKEVTGEDARDEKSEQTAPHDAGYKAENEPNGEAVGEAFDAANGEEPEAACDQAAAKTGEANDRADDVTAGKDAECEESEQTALHNGNKLEQAAPLEANNRVDSKANNTA